MIDYPGFGKTTGKMSEERLYSDALIMYRMARSRFTPDSIIIYGKSLGTGIASHLAAIRDCRQLILETPYYSIPDLFDCYAFIYPTSRMTEYKIPTYEYLREVSAPVTIFHGTSDGVIPYRCAVKLKEELKPGDQFITIENGTHRNLNSFPLFRAKFDSLLR